MHSKLLLLTVQPKEEDEPKELEWLGHKVPNFKKSDGTWATEGERLNYFLHSEEYLGEDF